MENNKDANLDLPVIELKPGDRLSIIKQSEAALIKSGIKIYQRGRQLVRIEKWETSTGGARKKRSDLPEYSTNVVVVKSTYLTYAFAKSARYVKYSVRKGRLVPADPPAAIARFYLAMLPENCNLPLYNEEWDKEQK